MKNFFLRTKFLLLSLSLITLSCSKENDEVINSKNNSGIAKKIASTELDAAKKLFTDMINSNDYLAYKEALNAFVTKLDGNTIDLFKDKEEAMAWISVNLSKTQFTSTTEFGNMLDDMETKHTTLKTNNKQLFTYMSNADEFQLLEIIKPSLGTPPTVTTFGACSNACMDSTSESIDALNGWYNFNFYMHNIRQETAFMMVVINAIYWSGYENIIGNFNNCMSAC